MDRVVAMILQTPSIREVTAFPKNRSAFCPLTRAPSPATREQLTELSLLDPGDRETLPGAESRQDPVDYLAWVSRIGVTADERPLVTRAVEDAEKLAAELTGQAPEQEPAFSVVQVKGGNRLRDGRKARAAALAASGALFKNAPAVKGDYFKVASIIE